MVATISLRFCLCRPPLDADGSFVHSDVTQGRVEGRSRKEVLVKRKSWACLRVRGVGIPWLTIALGGYSIGRLLVGNVFSLIAPLG